VNIFGTLGSRESIASQSLEWLIGGDLLCVNIEYRHFWKAPELIRYNLLMSWLICHE